MQETAIYLNGIWRHILEEISEVHCKFPMQPLIIQPIGDWTVRYLEDESTAPSSKAPVTLYASTHDDLQTVYCTAEIVKWNAKELMGNDLEKVQRIIEAFQKTEGAGLFKKSRFFQVREMRRFAEPFPVEELIKVADGHPLSPHRARPGGFSYVRPLKDLPPFADC